MKPIHERTEDANVPETARTQETVAMFGTGTMGHGMAASALRAHIPTIVWDVNADRSRDLAGVGAQVADTAVDAAGRAGIAVTMVPDADAVMSIATDQGMLDALARNAVWVQMSTIGVAGIDRVGALVKNRRPDVTLIDAPVSGSKEPAEQGQLTIFASGADHARSRVAPLFDALGQRTVWVGPLGAGSRMKLVNNTLPWDTAKLQRIAKDEYSPQFALALALKDAHLALETVDASRFESFASLAHEWERDASLRLRRGDLSVVDDYDEHGRIHGLRPERAERAITKAWATG